jgi:hypothetical protein
LRTKRHSGEDLEDNEDAPENRSVDDADGMDKTRQRFLWLYSGLLDGRVFLNRRAFIQALVAAGLFGIATPFSKSLLAGVQANQLAGLLYLGAAVCLFPLVLRRWLAGSIIFPRDGRNRRNLLGAILFGGVIGPVLLLVGLKHSLGVSVSMWLNLEAVATAVLAHFLFREHEHPHDDPHHGHAHAGNSPATPHTHPHQHTAMAHAHPHWPDLHHRHSRGGLG